MSEKENIKLTGWDIIAMYPVLMDISKMRWVASKAVSNLNYIMNKIFKIEQENQLMKNHFDIVQKYAVIEGENQTTFKVDKTKMDDYVKESDELFAKEFEIERWRIEYPDFYETKFDIPMDQWYLLSKIIDFEK